MAPAKSNKLNYINAVRGWAILLVIILHVANATKGLPGNLRYICSKGAFGVQLFFVASAFTLFRSYTSRIKNEKRAVRNFFTRRFARISPMYYTAAIVYAIIFYFIPAYNDGKPLALWKVAANILYVNSFVPGAINYVPPGGWSVGVEMLFYCCVPFLFARIKSFKTAVKWFIACGLGAVVLKLVIRYLLSYRGIDYHAPESWFLYFWFPNQAAVFIAGIALFYYLQTAPALSKKRVYTGVSVSILVLFVFAWFVRDIDPYNIIPEHIIIAVLFTVIIYFGSQHTIRMLDNRVTRFLGEISFSLYLVHFIVVYVLADHFPFSTHPSLAFVELLALTLVISAIISTLTWWLIEKPGIAAGGRYINKNSSLEQKAEEAVW